MAAFGYQPRKGCRINGGIDLIGLVRRGQHWVWRVKGEVFWVGKVRAGACKRWAGEYQV